MGDAMEGAGAGPTVEGPQAGLRPASEEDGVQAGTAAQSAEPS
jgi:hypothetical protein